MEKINFEQILLIVGPLVGFMWYFIHDLKSAINEIREDNRQASKRIDAMYQYVLKYIEWDKKDVG